MQLVICAINYKIMIKCWLLAKEAMRTKDKILLYFYWIWAPYSWASNFNIYNTVIWPFSFSWPFQTHRHKALIVWHDHMFLSISQIESASRPKNRIKILYIKIDEMFRKNNYKKKHKMDCMLFASMIKSSFWQKAIISLLNNENLITILKAAQNV